MSTPEMNCDPALAAALGTMIFGQRQARGLTRREIADRAGIGEHLLSPIERGERLPSVVVLGKLARALGKLARALGMRGSELLRAAEDQVTPLIPEPESEGHLAEVVPFPSRDGSPPN